VHERIGEAMGHQQSLIAAVFVQKRRDLQLDLMRKGEVGVGLLTATLAASGSQLGKVFDGGAAQGGINRYLTLSFVFKLDSFLEIEQPRKPPYKAAPQTKAPFS